MTGSMNYDQRINYLKNWFGSDILSRFNMPKDLDQKIIAMDTIEAINRNIPNGVDKERMGQIVASTTKELAQSATSRTLPSIKAFIDATQKASQSHGAGRGVPISGPLDQFAITAKRVAVGGDICESYLREPRRSVLIKNYGVHEHDLEPYDKYLAEAAHKQ